MTSQTERADMATRSEISEAIEEGWKVRTLDGQVGEPVQPTATEVRVDGAWSNVAGTDWYRIDSLTVVKRCTQRTYDRTCDRVLDEHGYCDRASDHNA